MGQAKPAPGAEKKTVFGYVANFVPPPAGGAPATAPAPAPTPSAPAAAPPVQMPPVPAAGAEIRVPVAPPRRPSTAHEAAPPVAAARSEDGIGDHYRLGGARVPVPCGELCYGSDARDRTEVEILLVDPAVFPSPLDMERARRELRQLQKAEHPAIVRVLDHGKTEDGRLFVVSERVKGTLLSDFIVTGQLLGLAEAQKVVLEVGSALAEAQKVGVVHRDIAPHNVSLLDGWTVKIGGFPLAPPLKRHVFGTPEFISPEQASGRPVDQRSNIYSLGALLFYTLTGRPPFQSSNVDELLEKHVKEEPPSVRSVRPDLNLPGRVDALIQKALSKSSSRRHLTLRQFLREVEGLTGGADDVAAVGGGAPLSFETPLHGMTALTGGDRPPSSEVPALRATPSRPALGMDEWASTVVDAQTLPPEPDEIAPPTGEELVPAPHLAKTMPPPPAHMAPTIRPDFGIPAPSGLSPTPSATAPVAPPRPVTVPPPIGAHAAPAASGEMTGGGGVTLRAAPQPVVPPPSETRPAAAPPPTAAAAAQGGRPAFRETMWFFKGEVEAAAAQAGEESVALAPAPGEEAINPAELAGKYADDGSMSEAEARRLSLRTGKTQMMQAVRVPGGPMPGERMDAEDFVGEMNKRTRMLIYVGIAAVVLVLVGVGIFLGLRK
ncbi:MAG: serine/threonine protein kinase [Deltaproteobacteria bacterium]|nr:serine/threonine protein kinase [Deltaproteobacteria bacterium]